METVVTRTITVWMSLMFVCLLFADLSYAEIDPDTCVGLWLFDKVEGDTARDSSDNGHDGEIIGDVETVDGKFGSALEFPGIDSNYVSIQHEDSLNLKTWSITAWVKVRNTGQYGTIVGKQRVLKPVVRNYLMGVRDSGILWVSFTQGEGDYKTTDSETTIPDETWHHVAATYDGKSTLVYVDGILEAEMEWGGDPDTHEGDMAIGALTDGEWPIPGIIDEVGLFSEALSKTEINDLMTNGLQSVLAVVEPANKLAASWGCIKLK